MTDPVEQYFPMTPEHYFMSLGYLYQAFLSGGASDLPDPPEVVELARRAIKATGPTAVGLSVIYDAGEAE